MVAVIRKAWAAIFALILFVPNPAMSATPEEAEAVSISGVSDPEVLALGAFVEHLLQMELRYGPKLPSELIETPDLEIPEEAGHEIVIPLPGGRKIIITRDPATGRIRIKIWFPGILMPSINYFIVCDENGCVLKHNLGAVLCRFEEEDGRLRVKCDSAILGLTLNCIAVEVPNELVPGGLVCVYCTEYKIRNGDGNWEQPIPLNQWLCDPVGEVIRLWRHVPALFRPFLPLIPEWLPVLPRLFPSLFPPELFPPPSV